MKITHAFAAVLVAGFFGPVHAQVGLSPAVPNLWTTPGVQSPNAAASAALSLSLADAIQRGLQTNLGVLLQEQEVRLQHGKRWQELADVLPHMSAGIDETRVMFNPEAFGFPGSVVGPFRTFDARMFASQPLLDIANLYEAKMEAASTTAERHSYKHVRDLVVTSIANLYFQVSATAARLAATQAHAGKAQVALVANRSAGTDSLPARARLLGQRQRVITLQNTLAKQKLALARAIGLPHGRQFTLTDQMPYAPLQPISLDAALQRAWRDRADVQAQIARVKAAEAKLRSANGRRLPTVRLQGDYGKIGLNASSAKMTFGIGFIVRVPIIQGGNIRGEVLEADAELKQEKAKLNDLRDAIYYEIQNALLDVQAAAEQVQLARGSMELAEEQLARFVAGSSPQPIGSAAVFQAQEAEENVVLSLYTYNVAKLTLARALGIAEESYMEFLR